MFISEKPAALCANGSASQERYGTEMATLDMPLGVAISVVNAS